MGLWTNLKDAVRRKKSRDFARELSHQFMLSPLCSDYENLFAQVRPLIDEMKLVKPYGMGRNGARLQTSRTPELEWLDNPNDEMGWSEFSDLMFATWLTEDELDIHVWKNRSGRVIGYTVIPPQCRIYLGYGRWEWQVMTTAGLEVLGEEDVMRLRFSRSPRDIQKGVSPASAVRVWAMIDDLISQYQKAYFENGAIPATITFITASTKEKYEETRKELERKLKGAQNHNKTVFAWRQFDGDTGDSVDQIEVKTIQGSNSTLAIKDIVNIINDRLNKSVGVSNFILGDDSSAKYDNAELSDHQFTKRRVYPALVSFWNQFQHELDRITGGLGYGISFDLEIPELTEREKVKAEIAKIRGESLVDLISAGASSSGAVAALGLPQSWMSAADGIYIKTLENKVESPITIDAKCEKTANLEQNSSEKPAETEVAVDEGHKCCHTLDQLPEMTKDEKRLYEILVELAKSIASGEKEVDLDNFISRMTQILQSYADSGAVDGAKALEMLADKDVAGEIAKMITNGEVFISKALGDRIAKRAEELVKGYEGYTREVVEEVLNSDEPMSAAERKAKLAAVLPTSRAEMIARNETVYAIKSGRLEQDQQLANKYGIKVRLVWRSSHDSHVCPVCAAMDGKTVSLGEAFVDHLIAGKELTEEQLKEYNLDPETSLDWVHSKWNDDGKIPDAHVNCRCYFDEEIV